MPVVNGRTIYSDSIFEALNDISQSDRLKIDLPQQNRYRKIILRLIFFVTLLPSIWIDSLLRYGRVKKELKKISNPKEFEYVFLDHMQLWWLIFPVRKLFPDAKIILVSHNLEHRAKISYVKYGPLLLKIAALMDLFHVYIWETICTKLSDGVISLNKEEKKFYDSISDKQENYLVYPFIDLSKNAPKSSPDRRSHRLVLVGSYSYKAKEVNALWLIEEIMPEVVKQMPGGQLDLVGRGVTERMKNAAKGKPYINIVGEVDELDRWYNNAKAVIIPEKLGGGFKLKILEAVSYGRPMILHREAYMGTAFKHNEDCLVFESAEECQQAIVKICNNPDFTRKLVQNAFSKAENYHKMEHGKKELKKIFNY